MKCRTRRNPHALDVAWTGKKANYVSPRGNYGETGHSELAMHTGGAGKAVVRFALWKRPAKGYAGPADAVNWAQVEYQNGQILDGLPSEVLPGKVRDIIGYGSPRMPRRKQKLQLWALSKGVAANRGRKNPLTAREAKGIFKEIRWMGPVLRDPRAAHYKQFVLGRIAGKANIVSAYGRGRGVRDRGHQIERVADRMAHGTKKVRMVARANRSRKNAPNLSTSRHAAATWKIGEAAHKFLAHMDRHNLGLWRDVTMWDVMTGSQKATSARKACSASVADRFTPFVITLNRLWPFLQKKEIAKAPLRIAAGSWGMMEQMRSDF